MSHHEQEDDFSLKKLFVPLTTLKAIHIIVIVGFIVFGNMLFNGFVGDDKVFIINNSQLYVIDISKLFGPNLFNDSGYYRPITATYFAFLYFLFGKNFFFYHVIQLILHISNAIIVFFLFKKFFSKIFALFAALIFLVHPMQVESVSYIASSGNPLFFLFGSTALLLSTRDHINPKRASIIFVLLLLSFFTRETGLLFLVIILFYKILFKRKNIALFLFSGILITAVYVFIRVSIGKVFLEKYIWTSIAQLSFTERLINIPAIIFYYIKTFFYPKQLVIEQQWVITNPNFINFYFPLVLVTVFFILIVLLGVYIYKCKIENFRKYVFFLIWFVFGILLHVQIFPLDMTVADRWFYFPLVGLLGLCSLALQLLMVDKKHIKLLFYCIAIIIFVFSIRTIIRNANWQDPITLYKHDTKILTNFNMENNLGMEYAQIENYDIALKHFNNSVDLFPFEFNLTNLGHAYEKKGDLYKAKKYYQMALDKKYILGVSEKPPLTTYKRLILVSIKTKDFDYAKNISHIALAQYSNSKDLWALLAISEYNLGHHSEALAAAGKAKKIAPNDRFINYLYSQITNKQQIDLNIRR